MRFYIIHLSLTHVRFRCSIRGPLFVYLRDALHFCNMKLTLFCVSTTSGLLHDVFQRVSVHPIPIEICYGLLSNACRFVT